MASRPGRAFTLIELLGVIAIIIILAGLVLGAAFGLQSKGAQKNTEALLETLAFALEAYHTDHRMYVPSEYSPPNPDETLTRPLWYALDYKGRYGLDSIPGRNRKADGEFTDAATGETVTHWYYVDAWKKGLEYTCTSDDNFQTCTLQSAGPDKTIGNEDDIVVNLPK
jgi:type II secretory pathway pseudopilin PulG